jgi:membrane-associated protease RseP (regulator of RpoE activity)
MRPNSSGFSFNLFGFPTFIQPFFWLIAALIAVMLTGGINDNMPIWIAKVLVGMAVVLVSVLVHELGHALTFRYLFHTPCTIVLHGLGGMAVPAHHYRTSGFSGALAQCFLSFSGPLAGFILAGVAFTLLRSISVPENPGLLIGLFQFFLFWTTFVSIFWGILNLMPIYPMDGGHIAREVCIFLFPQRGIEYSLILSMVVAVLLIVVALQIQPAQIIIAILFGYLAFQNYQEWSARTFRR